MNDFEEMQLLLDAWTEVIKTCAKDSTKNASRMKDGIDGLVIILDGRRVIFDYPSDKRQAEIQQKLCHLRPDLTVLIMSEPSIFDEQWRIKDYLELCYNHYMTVIFKLRNITDAKI